MLIVRCANMGVGDGEEAMACGLQDARWELCAVCCGQEGLGAMCSCTWRVGAEGRRDAAVEVCGDECRRRWRNGARRWRRNAGRRDEDVGRITVILRREVSRTEAHCDQFLKRFGKCHPSGALD